MVVHGDEFNALGGRNELVWYEEGLAVAFKVWLRGAWENSLTVKERTKGAAQDSEDRWPRSVL